MKAISKAKPFIKWVGGKGQLLEQLDAQLPANFSEWEDVAYTASSFSCICANFVF